MKSKKFISVFLIFLFFINAGDIEDAEINISAQRVDSVSYTHLTLPTNREV